MSKSDNLQDDMAGLIEALRLHAHDDCGGQDLPTHVCNIAATGLETLTRENAELFAQIEQLKLTNAAIVQTSQIVARADERTRTQLTATQARLAEAVGHLAMVIDRASKGCSLEGEIVDFPSVIAARAFLAQQEGQSNG